MADTQNTIRNRIEFVGLEGATKQLQTFQETLRDVKKAYELATRSESKTVMFNGEIKSADEMKQRIDTLLVQIQQLKTEMYSGTAKDTFIDSQTKALERQEIQAQKTAEKLKQINATFHAEQQKLVDQQAAEWERMKKNYKPSTEGVMNPNLVSQIKEQFANRAAIEQAQSRTALAESNAYYDNEARRIKENTAQHKAAWKEINDSMGSLSVQAADINKRWEQNYLENYGKNMDKYAENAKRLKGEAADVTKRINQMGAAFEASGNKADYLGSFMQKLRSHFNWLVAGTFLTAAFAVPYEFISSLKEIEQGMAGMQQVSKELHESQGALNDQTMKSIDLAALYGTKVTEVIDVMKLWGRAYKDLAIVNEFTRQSLILEVADNMQLMDATKGLEAAMFQYGQVAKTVAEATAYAGKVVDVFTNVSHNAQVSATDLAHGVEQAGAVAHMTGVDFEFLTAMIATGVRGTAKSGNEIGTMIKSVLGSFQSEKAQKELEKIGVSVKQVGKDGQESFRKAQDVLLDLALTAQATNQDVSKMFQAISGGKWQWSKAGAMLGDYKTFIETWGLAVKSAGFSAGQIGVQIDTLSRRIEKLKADLEGLVVNTGNAGISQWLKGQLDGIDKAVLGLQQLNSAQVKIIMGIPALLLALSAVASVYRTVALAAGEAALATTTLGKAAVFASKWNIVVTVLTGVAFVIGTILEKTGEVAEAQRKATDEMDSNIAKANQQLDMYRQQNEFVESLISAHKKMQEQLDSGSLTEEKSIAVKQNMQATLEELTKVTGDDGIAQLVAAGNYEEASNIEKQAFQSKSDEIRSQINDLHTKQIEYTQTQADATLARIDMLKSETAAWGIVGETIKSVIDLYAGFFDARIKVEQKLQDIVGKDNLETIFGKRGWDLEGDIAFRESLRNYRPEWIQNDITNSEQKLNDLEIKLQKLRISNGIVDYQTPPPGGNKIVDDGGSKGAGAQYPPVDRGINVESKVDKFQLDSTINKAKTAADRYKTILSTIDDMQNRLGASYEFLDQRVDAMKNHMADLQKTIESLASQADGDIAKINDLATETGATITVSGGNNSPQGIAWDYFTNQGYSPELTSALIGNLISESGLNPTAVAGDGSGSYGIGQWLGDRLQGLYDFAAANNSDVDDLRTQLAYIDYELKHSEANAMNKIMSGNSTPEEYAYAVSKYYERPQWAANPDRQQNARSIYDQYLNGGFSGTHDVTIEGMGDVLSSHGISQDEWRGYSKEQQLAFVREYKEQINDSNALIGYLERLTDTEKKQAEYQKQLAETRKEIYETIIKGLDEIRGYQDKLTDLKERSTIASYGIYMADFQKDEAELTAFIEKKQHLDTLLAQARARGIDVNSYEYKSNQVQSDELGNKIKALQQQKLPEDNYAYTKRNIDHRETMATADVPYSGVLVYQNELDVKIKAMEENKAALEKILAGMKTKDSESDPQYQQYKEQLVSIEKELDHLKDKYYDTRKFWADSLLDMANNGTKFSDILKNIWRDIAKEALYAIMKIRSGTNSIGTSMLSLLGINLGGTSSSSFSGAAASFTSFGGSTEFAHATGTISDTEHLAAISEGNKREAVIPLEDHKDRGQSLWVQAGKELGMLNGSGVVPYLKNPGLAQQATTVVVQKDNAHIAALQESNDIMKKQLQVMLHMDNKGTSGGATALQPIITTNQMSTSEFSSMYNRAIATRQIK